jgi:hypothetical protein
MTEQSTEEVPEIAPDEQRPVEYMGRTFTALAPQPEQILVWQRTLEQLGGQDYETWDGKQAMKALGRIRKIVDSLLSPEDIEWIDDQMLERDPARPGRTKFTLENAHELMMKVIDAFRVTNREERRAEERAAKTQPARRVPAKKTAAKKATPRRTA